MPIRLLYLRDTSFVCGPGKTILNTYRTIDRERFQLEIAVPTSPDTPNSFIEQAEALGITVHHLRRGRNELAGIARLTALIKGRYDIVQSHDFATRRLAAPATALAGVSHVTSVHGWIANSRKARWARRADQLLIGRARRAIAVSNLLRDQLVSSGVSTQKIEYLPNAVLLSDYDKANTIDPAEAKRSIGLSADARVLSIIGRLSPEKGHRMFLTMARRVAETPGHEDVRFLVIGDGPLRPDLEHEVREAGLVDRVLFLGLRLDMAQMYSATDALILASTTEGMPNVVLEAFAHRRPVVATRVGGVPDLVVHGSNGYLIESGDADALTTSVLALLSDSIRAAAFGKAGRRLIEEQFDFTSRTARLQQLYEGL